MPTSKSSLDPRLVILGVIFLLAIGAGVAVWATGVYKGPQKPFQTGDVHWHAPISVIVCGEKLTLPNAAANHVMNKVHHHDDNKIHIEGELFTPEDANLEHFFTNMGQTFNSSEVMGHRSGDMCPEGTEPATVSMKVNGANNTDFEKYSIRDGDTIEIRFE